MPSKIARTPVKRARKTLTRTPRTHFTVGRYSLEMTPVFDAYWQFAAERQRIFYRRIARSNSPEFSDDPILTTYKFTNAYRASDRISQYLIRSVIYRDDLPSDPENLFFRTLLFKLFNKIETWEALESACGALSIARFDFKAFDHVLNERMEAGERIYSAAYIMPSARVFGHERKHANHLRLIEWMLDRRLPQKLAASERLSDAYELLLEVPSLGPFLAFQFAIDLNYSPLMSHSEMDFVVAGPGALDGISKCFVDTQGIAPAQIIAEMAEQQDEMFEERGIAFPSLWGRRLQLIDCQNLFCEISKYSRVAYPTIGGVAGRTRIKQKFQSSRALPIPWYPPAWDINDRLDQLPLDMMSPGSPTARMEQLTLF
jgi:hypothetical protein